MRAFPASLRRHLQKPKFWLGAIAACLIVFHLNVGWRLNGSVDQLSIGLLFWGAALTLVWQRRDSLNLESNTVSGFSGLLLIGLILFRSLSVKNQDDLLNDISPFISMLGLALLASGARGLKQYWRELVIVLTLSIPVATLSSLIESKVGVSTLVAKFSTFALWYLGFDVSREGVNVMLPKGAIEIYSGCSGLDAMLLLLRLAILFVLLFPLKPYEKLLGPVVAVLLAFMVNGVRVTLMAVLVASSNQEAFAYWHGAAGSQIFSVLSLLLFGLFCRLLLRQTSSLREGLEAAGDTEQG